MIICEHDETENPNNIQFTVVFEKDEPKLLRAVMETYGISAEKAVHMIIMWGLHN